MIVAVEIMIFSAKYLRSVLKPLVYLLILSLRDSFFADSIFVASIEIKNFQPLAILNFNFTKQELNNRK